MATLDMDLLKELETHVEALTHSGKPALDAELMKKVKKICRLSDEYVKQVFHLVMSELNQDHSEIRLSAFLIIDELFNRSHCFRTLLLDDFSTFLELCAEVDPGVPLPPPKPAAKALKSKVYECIQKWKDKYAEAYKQLALGYNYLKNCKKVDFNDINARSIAERQREEQSRQKREKMQKDRCDGVLQEMKEYAEDIDNCLTQLEGCFQLLLPSPEDFDVLEPSSPQPGPSNISLEKPASSGSPSTNSPTDEQGPQLEQKPPSSQASGIIKDEAIGRVNESRTGENSCHFDSGSSNTKKANNDRTPKTLKGIVIEDNEVPSTSKGMANEDNTIPSTSKGIAIEDNVVPSTSKGMTNEDSAIPSTSKGMANKDNAIPSTTKGMANEDISIPCTSKGFAIEDNAIPSTSKGMANEDIAIPSTSKGIAIEDNVIPSTSKGGNACGDPYGQSEDDDEDAYDEEDDNDDDDEKDDDEDDNDDDEDDDEDDDFEEVPDLKGEDEGEGAGGAGDFMQQHGLGSMHYEISINLLPEIIDVHEDDDNTDILTNLEDMCLLVEGKYLPAAARWLEILGKNGGKQEDVKKAIDIKQNLLNASNKSKKIRVHWRNKPSTVTQGASGAHVNVVPTDAHGTKAVKRSHVPDRSLPSTSTGKPSSSVHGGKRKKQEQIDPTSMEYNRARLDEQFSAALGGNAIISSSVQTSAVASSSPSSSSSSSSSQQRKRKNPLLKKAPVVPYGMDLKRFEGEKIEVPMTLRKDSDHRFWRPIDNEEVVDQNALEALNKRVMHYTGDFQPVQWRCRAPMPNGTLCPRMDRIKCPFHGEIIARDQVGNPSKPEDMARVKKQEEKQKNDEPKPWEDEELQLDIQAATGIDLKKKPKGRGRKKKESGLTNINSTPSTSRSRLEKKIFNKSAMRRVANAMSAIDARLRKNKFADNFTSLK